MLVARNDFGEDSSEALLVFLQACRVGELKGSALIKVNGSFLYIKCHASSSLHHRYVASFSRHFHHSCSPFVFPVEIEEFEEKEEGTTTSSLSR